MNMMVKTSKNTSGHYWLNRITPAVTALRNIRNFPEVLIFRQLHQFPHNSCSAIRSLGHSCCCCFKLSVIEKKSGFKGTSSSSGNVNVLNCFVERENFPISSLIFICQICNKINKQKSPWRPRFKIANESSV